jgi:hypothetical protein
VFGGAELSENIRRRTLHSTEPRNGRAAALSAGILDIEASTKAGINIQKRVTNAAWLKNMPKEHPNFAKWHMAVGPPREL